MTVAARNGSQPDRPRWILIPNWGKFQHYRDRRPVWIKSYLDQHDRDEYLELPAGTRALLHDLRLMYARRRGQIRLDTRWLSGELHVRVTTQQLEALHHAGFISFSASKPVPIRYESGPSLARAREEGYEVPPKRGASAAGLDGRGERRQKNTRRADPSPRYLTERT